MILPKYLSQWSYAINQLSLIQRGSLVVPFKLGFGVPSGISYILHHSKILYKLLFSADTSIAK